MNLRQIPVTVGDCLALLGQAFDTDFLLQGYHVVENVNGLVVTALLPPIEVAEFSKRGSEGGALVAVEIATTRLVQMPEIDSVLEIRFRLLYVAVVQVATRELLIATGESSRVFPLQQFLLNRKRLLEILFRFCEVQYDFGREARLGFGLRIAGPLTFAKTLVELCPR